MDLALYQFDCQKLFYFGLQFAKGFGHAALEVEHVVYAALKSVDFRDRIEDSERLLGELENYLNSTPKYFGVSKINFGLRLNAALDHAEKAAQGALIEFTALWPRLIGHSPFLKSLDPKLVGKSSAKAAPEETKRKASGNVISGSSNAARVAKSILDRPLEPNAPSKARGSEAKGGGTKENANQQNSSKVKSAKDKAANQGSSESDSQIPKDAQEVLAKYTIDLSARAERGELDPVIGRDKEIRQAIEVLGRKKKNNPVLIGEPGVGKSAIAEGLALKIARGEVPQSLKGKRILSLDLGALLAGAKFRGEFEERLRLVVKGIKACEGEVIAFIDEIHMLIGAGGSEGTMDAANLLKPALARGELHCLGATTFNEYRKYIEKDAALSRRFEAIQVDEPDAQTTLAILRGLKSYYEIFHGVPIEDEALVEAVRLSDQFIPGRQQPDKAIDLIDEAASRLRLVIDSIPAEMDQLKAKIVQLEIERQALGEITRHAGTRTRIDVELARVRSDYQEYERIWLDYKAKLDAIRSQEQKKLELEGLYQNATDRGDFEFAARLSYFEIPKLLESIATLREDLNSAQARHPFLSQRVGPTEIARIIADKTGIPLNRLRQEPSDRVRNLNATLNEKVFGQKQALRRISQTVKRIEAGIHDPRRPLAVFLFVGPTGVGKTEAAKALAEELFHDPKKFVRIDMSELSEAHTIARLIGSPPGYVGYREAGQLTEAVRRAKHCIVLLDEVEKAHPKVFDLLLQVFDEGRLTDAEGKLIDFRQTILIMTSNLITEGDFGSGEDDEALRQELMRSLRPEFVGRIDEIIRFEPLGAGAMLQLVERYLLELNQRISERNFRIKLSPQLIDALLAEVEQSAIGARAIRRIFKNTVGDATAERILNEPQACRGSWLLDLDDFGKLQWRMDAGPLALTAGSGAK